MDRLAVAAVTCIAACLGSAHGQCSDSDDHTLCVPHLSHADSAAFSTTDHLVSAFWANWGVYDSIVLSAPQAYYPGRCDFRAGAADARVVVKAAGTSIGLYLLAVVADGHWVDPANADDWGADALEIFFANEDSATIASCTDCRIGLYNSALTYTTQSFATWMGATSLPTGCRAGFYDQNLWSWTVIAVQWAALKSRFGVEVDIVQVDATHKAQEWFVPWDRFGMGFAPGTELANKRMGMSIGYNDKDGDDCLPGCLRWVSQDPWTGAYWGNLLLAPDMPNVPSWCACGGTAVDVAAASPNAAAKVVYSQYFGLDGRRSAAGTPRLGGVALQVSRRSDGSVERRLVRSAPGL